MIPIELRRFRPALARGAWTDHGSQADCHFSFNLITSLTCTSHGYAAGMNLDLYVSKRKCLKNKGAPSAER